MKRLFKKHFLNVEVLVMHVYQHLFQNKLILKPILLDIKSKHTHIDESQIGFIYVNKFCFQI